MLLLLVSWENFPNVTKLDNLTKETIYQRYMMLFGYLSEETECYQKTIMHQIRALYSFFNSSLDSGLDIWLVKLGQKTTKLTSNAGYFQEFIKNLRNQVVGAIKP